MSSVEERLAKLENEVEQLELASLNGSGLSAKKPNWISKISGSFEGDPEFDEILRLGREERRSDMLNDE